MEAQRQAQPRLLLRSMLLPPRPSARCDELREIARPNTYRVVYPHVRKVAVFAEAIDGPRADRELLRDIGDPQQAVPAVSDKGVSGPRPFRLRTVPIRVPNRVPKFLGFPCEWLGRLDSGAVSPPVMVAHPCERFRQAAMVPIPFRDRKVGGSNPLAPTTLSPISEVRSDAATGSESLRRCCSGEPRRRLAVVEARLRWPS